MKAWLLIFAGALIFGLTMLAWVWLNAMACGMNTTGCRGFSLHWSDWESLQYFVPTFVIGAGLFVWGVRLARRRD